MDKDWNIGMIEALTEEEAQEMALESLVVKEHNVYLVDFGGYFGYSALVFADHHHITHANDYALHHSGKNREELKAWYLENLPNILFTEQEIVGPVKNYAEFTRKKDYLHNLYSQRRDHESMFYIEAGHAKEETAARRKKISAMIPDPVAFAYYSPDDRDFVDAHMKLFVKLIAAEKETLNCFEYQKNAFIYEMANHEYAINWDGDFDTLSAFGNLRPTRAANPVENYFKQLGFTALQKKAYYAARAEYLKRQEETA